ncbi:autophagy protein Apg9 [Blastomyces gilchristii SLH14081]|uniref:Autophagy-related protein 9 n=1 Tax=Blastomyces gilchristii (strain SLH14081) TaxID=559298 RepID=A0A179U8M0_BLAGS|nr:autophagy protein Apg9 [Blastomyces gilchristii SLH14081]OAT03668.1 autophagy protein Apg9 [Blastomyces gilchristii SLH14081]
MTSNLISRFLPANSTTSPSIYETIQQYDKNSDSSDIEERAGMSLDEENLRGPYEDYELEEALATASDTQSTTQSTLSLQQPPRKAPQGFPGKSKTPRKANRHKWTLSSPRPMEDDRDDDDVPASLLVEGDDDDVGTQGLAAPPPHRPPNRNIHDNDDPLPLSTQGTRNRWDSARAHQPIHPIPPRIVPAPPRAGGQRRGLAFVDPKEKAMWRWANVENLDNFLADVYDYFLGNGIKSIFLSRVLNLLTLAFVVGFTVFLTSCIDYRRVPNSKTMTEIVVPQCVRKMSASSTLLLWLFSIFWIYQAVRYLLDLRRLYHLHDFYHYLLGISDTDIQTISWQEIVSRLMALRDSNPSTAGAVSARNRKFLGSQSKQRMDAHDIANRLMRKDNYLIALFNKDILDLTLPIPFLRNRQLFSRTLEWNLHFCILDYVFNDQGQVRTLFLKDTHRKALSDGLRRRFLISGLLNIFIAPFFLIYFMMHYFFRYFNEYQKNPSQIGSRQYTPLAEWKFREFNELRHLFQRRINMSYPFATRYIDQFPKDKMVQIARFVGFIAGALASVLALASVVDPELFLGFEISHDRTVLFYLGVTGTVWAVARGLVPEETLVFDPEFALREVIDFTHYQPAHWQGKLHSDEVKAEFAMLYQMKVLIFLEELLSIIFIPFVLWFSLPKCSDRLIDFFREFTVHVDGLGYVCSFAVFDFKKGTNVIPQNQDTQQGGAQDAGQRDLRNDYFSTKDGKMLASYYGFLDNYANNPQPGAPYIHAPNRRRFHPPPSFPALTSPPMMPEANYMGTGRQYRWDAQQRSVTRPNIVGSHAGGHSITPRTPRFGVAAAAGAHNSPLASVLLDPHHQPSTSGFRPQNRNVAQSQYRPSRQAHPMNDTIRDEDEPSGTSQILPGLHRHPSSNMTTGSSGADDSRMEESWRMNIIDGEGETDEETENVQDVVGGAGVLGLIHQFQKVSNDGRGGGAVGI